MSRLEGLVTVFIQVPLNKTPNLSCSSGAAQRSVEDCPELLPGVNVCNCTMNVKQGIAGQQQACLVDLLCLKKKKRRRKVQWCFTVT